MQITNNYLVKVVLQEKELYIFPTQKILKIYKFLKKQCFQLHVSIQANIIENGANQSYMLLP